MSERIATGYLFGDCQYSPHMETPEDHHPGVFACYRPVEEHRAISPAPKALTPADWASLYRMVRGLVLALDGRPIPNPVGWL